MGTTIAFPRSADLIGRGVDLIVTRGTPAARSAKAATATIPIVMAAIGEPLGVDVVASLAQPGGNVGFSAIVTELSGKRVELLKETFPSIARAAGLIDKIFKGAPPANLPVEQPTKLELVINLKTTKLLGLEVSQCCSPAPTRLSSSRRPGASIVAPAHGRC